MYASTLPQVFDLRFQKTTAERTDCPVESGTLCRFEVLKESGHPGCNVLLKELGLRCVVNFIRLLGNQGHAFAEDACVVLGFMALRLPHDTEEEEI